MPTHDTTLRCSRASSSARAGSSCSPSNTHAARRNATRPIASSKSIVSPYASDATSSSMMVPMPASRASSAFLRNAGATDGCEQRPRFVRLGEEVLADADANRRAGRRRPRPRRAVGDEHRARDLGVGDHPDAHRAHAQRGHRTERGGFVEPTKAIGVEQFERFEDGPMQLHLGRSVDRDHGAVRSFQARSARSPRSSPTILIVAGSRAKRAPAPGSSSSAIAVSTRNA